HTHQRRDPGAAGGAADPLETLRVRGPVLGIHHEEVEAGGGEDVGDLIGPHLGDHRPEGRPALLEPRLRPIFRHDTRPPPPPRPGAPDGPGRDLPQRYDEERSAARAPPPTPRRRADGWSRTARLAR